MAVFIFSICERDILFFIIFIWNISKKSNVVGGVKKKFNFNIIINTSDQKICYKK